MLNQKKYVDAAAETIYICYIHGERIKIKLKYLYIDYIFVLLFHVAIFIPVPLVNIQIHTHMYTVTMLSMETPQHQGIYAPLKAMSDYDSGSEEEIHNSTKHHQIRQQQQELFIQHQPQIDLTANCNSRPNPPNTLNLQAKSYQQNRRKLQIERQRQLERNLYQQGMYVSYTFSISC